MEVLAFLLVLGLLAVLLVFGLIFWPFILGILICIPLFYNGFYNLGVLAVLIGGVAWYCWVIWVHQKFDS